MLSPKPGQRSVQFGPWSFIFNLLVPAYAYVPKASWNIWSGPQCLKSSRQCSYCRRPRFMSFLSSNLKSQSIVHADMWIHGLCTRMRVMSKIVLRMAASIICPSLHEMKRWVKSMNSIYDIGQYITSKSRGTAR